MIGSASDSADRGGAPALLGRFVANAVRPSYLLPFLLLLVAFLFGGISVGQPFTAMVIQLLGILLLAASAAGFVGTRFSPDSAIPLIFLAALVALLLFQMVPLPQGMWTALDGRKFSQSVLDLVGAKSGARPISLQPDQTMLALLAVIPGAAMAVAVMRLGTPARMALAWGVVIAAGLSLFLGIVQVSAGTNAGAFTLYKTSHTGLPIGIFANTNHQADLLVVGFVLAGSMAPPLRMAGGRWSERPYWIYGLMLAFAAGVVATGSRSGIVLLGLGLIALALRERLSGHARTFLLGGLVLGAALVLLVLFNPIFAKSFADFSDLDDPRFHFWPNVLWAIGHFGWFGSGAGTFDGVYRSAETLDTLSSNFVNHAHNEYLEILLETGIPGAALLLAFVGYFIWRSVSVIRRTEARVSRSLAYGGMVCVGLLLAHSAVDYPLRTPLLGIVFGFAFALMTRTPLREGERAAAPAMPQNLTPGVRYAG